MFPIAFFPFSASSHIVLICFSVSFMFLKFFNFLNYGSFEYSSDKKKNSSMPVLLHSGDFLLCGILFPGGFA